MALDPSQLPDDVTALKAMLIAAERRAADAEKKKREARAENDAFHIGKTGTKRAETIRTLIEQVKQAHPEMESIDVAEIVKAALLAGAYDDAEIEQFIAAQQKSAPPSAKK